MLISLETKKALVCGATGGIGKAIAIEMAASGAEVTLLARNAAALEQTLGELNTSKGQKHRYLQADFSQPNQVLATVEQQLKQGYSWHILVNNTGGPTPGKAIDAPAEQYLQGFNMHVVCSQLLAQALLPYMQSESYGRIINVISTSVKVPIAGLGVSNTIRGAMNSWAKTLSQELGPDGITVNNVLPGFTDTGRLDKIIANKAKSSGQSEAQMAEQMKQWVPARRFGRAEEVAAAAVFLASEKASYISGANLPVDGGRTQALW
jgi:3-oxoacyl-[acyl-carrier protein] reductase